MGVGKPEHELRMLRFHKLSNGKTLNCTVEECKDGSVYVSSDEFEILVEFVDDAIDKAVGLVVNAGYQRVQE
jgi:hypothetical protein